MSTHGAGPMPGADGPGASRLRLLGGLLLVAAVLAGPALSGLALVRTALLTLLGPELGPVLFELLDVLRPLSRILTVLAAVALLAAATRPPRRMDRWPLLAAALVAASELLRAAGAALGQGVSTLTGAWDLLIKINTVTDIGAALLLLGAAGCTLPVLLGRHSAGRGVPWPVAPRRLAVALVTLQTLTALVGAVTLVLARPASAQDLAAGLLTVAGTTVTSVCGVLGLIAAGLLAALAAPAARRAAWVFVLLFCANLLRSGMISLLLPLMMGNGALLTLNAIATWSLLLAGLAAAVLTLLLQGRHVPRASH